ncbi:MAG: Asp23/Gls24 family envelope stress response protein [Candidatus Omnitrophica bacterium]|nr:Asp23/Gls24 family envelope stress response protein [Candidatus Omnitrophota bacterium]
MTKEVNGNNLGSVSVDNEVIKNIALRAAIDIGGVYKTKKTLLKKAFRLLTRKETADGVKLDFVSDSELKVSLQLTVGYGMNIPHITGTVQDNVKRAIEYMTGLTVIEVNIKISDINLRENSKIEFEKNGDNPVSVIDDVPLM